MIDTRRLCIRSFREEDWQAVYVYSTDPEVVRYVPGELPSAEETQAVIRSWMNGQTDDPPHYDFAVTVRPDDFVIGWCCIQISSSDRRVGELMYVFNRQFWRNGYAIEATQAIVDYGFSELELHRLFATCRPENTASWHILEKLGMQRENLLRENVWIRGSWQNSYLYAIMESEMECEKIAFLDRVIQPNTACTRLVGVCAFSSSFLGSRLVPVNWRYLIPPTSG